MQKGTLYSDDNPKTTLKGLGFKNEDKAKETIEKVEKYFDKLMKKQKINSYTPDNVLPKKLLTTKKEIKKYYQLQKMYRITRRSKLIITRVVITKPGWKSSIKNSYYRLRSPTLSF